MRHQPGTWGLVAVLKDEGGGGYIYTLRNRHRGKTRLSLDHAYSGSRYQVTDHAGFGRSRQSFFLFLQGGLPVILPRSKDSVEILFHLIKWSDSFLSSILLSYRLRGNGPGKLGIALAPVALCLVPGPQPGFNRPAFCLRIVAIDMRSSANFWTERIMSDKMQDKGRVKVSAFQRFDGQ